MAKLTRSTLCLACKSIFKGGTKGGTTRNVNGEVAHHGLDALAVRASSGCQLCLTVYTSIDPEEYLRARKDVSFGDDSQGYATLTSMARDQARLQFRYTRMEGSPDLNDRRILQSPLSSNSSKTSLTVGSREEKTLSVKVELMLMNPQYVVEPGVRMIDLQSTSTASPESFGIAQRWINECISSHHKCSTNSSSTWKPTYLLDVSLRGAGGAQGVRLVDGVFLHATTEYVTLSHCWGTAKGIRLHKGTLPALRHGVAASNLPKTFTDAAMVTDKLGYKYLWIDALCIMHDNETAVLEEVAQMNRIYSEAVLNIAATASAEDSKGLIRNRQVEALQPCVIQVDNVGIDNGIYKVLRSRVWHDLVDSSPLSKRAWVLQERCLAKRTLHFSRNELLWECQQMCCSEVYPKGLPATIEYDLSEGSTEYLDKRTHHQKMGNWYQLVKMYSSGQISYLSDKLPAISALAKQYMIRNRLEEKDYIAGLWKSQLPQGLLWRVEQGQRPLRYRSPSWTWASIDGEISYSNHGQEMKDTRIEIVDTQIKYKSDTFGLVEGGKLKVRGFMSRGVLSRTQDYWGKTEILIRCPQSVLELESTWFDERLPKLSEEDGILTEHLEVYLLPVADFTDRVEGLILCSNIKRGEFRRLGTFEISKHDQLNWDRFRRVMKGDPNMHNYEARLDHPNGYWFASDYTYTINLL